MKDRTKFVLFSIGLAGAISSSATSFILLFSSVLGKQSLVYEPNTALALIEMLLLVLAIGTCVVASEVYYRYLDIKRSTQRDRPTTDPLRR